MKKILVTGANGFLATNVIICLLDQGYFVRGLLRDKSKFKAASHQNLQLIEGNFCDPQDAENALDGCDYVIHAAAITAQNLRRYDDYKAINVDATEQLLRLSVSKNIKRFVYVSSVNTIGFGSKDSPGTESNPMRYPFTKSHYARSKAAAEAIAISFSEKMDVVVANPTFMLGAYGSEKGSNQIFKLAKQRVIFCPPGGKNFIGVTDAAKSTVALLENGCNGEKYILAGENLSYREFFAKVAKYSNYSPIYVPVPKAMLLIAGYLGSLLRLMGVKTALSVTNARILCVRNYYDNSKLANMLGKVVNPSKLTIETNFDLGHL